MAITKKQYEELTSKPYEIIVSLSNRTPRTLLYGYTCARDTYHVYLDEEGCVNKYIYDYYNKTLLHKKYKILTNLQLIELIPDKRVYPESTDYEFLEILLENQVYIPFTCYDEERYERVKDLQYHGEII